MSLLARRLAWQRHERSPSRSVDLRTTILSSFTVHPLGPYLGAALLDSGWQPSIDIAPFDQVVQSLLGDALGDVDVAVVWIRLEDLWAGGRWPLESGDTDGASESLEQLAGALIDASKTLGITFVFVLPAMPDLVPLGVGDAANLSGVAATATLHRERFRSLLAGQPGVLIADGEKIMRELGSTRCLDQRRLAAATIPYTEEYFASVAAAVARLLELDRRGAKKVAVVDADNTLWGGVVGEEGASGVDLADQGPGVSYRQFQRYLLQLRRAGTIIAVASKNNESDALEVFDRREMELRVSDLAAWRINWSPKSSNLVELAEELNLGTSSMVFIDDSPLERAEVEAAVEGITVLEMPEDPAGWFDAIVRTGALDRLPPTNSDLGRANSYSEESRRTVAKRTTDIGSFLASLNLEVEVFAPTGVADIARLAQLVAKTNQFTLGGPRHTEALLSSMSADSSTLLRLVQAKDNYGDYGVVGALIITGCGSTQPRLDTFVLSCRAMGRGIEDAMLVAAQEAAQPAALTVVFTETAKNRPLRSWLHGVGPTTPDVESIVEPRPWPTHVNRVSAAAP